MYKKLFEEWLHCFGGQTPTLEEAFTAGLSCGAKFDGDTWHDLNEHPDDLPPRTGKINSRSVFIAMRQKKNVRYNIGWYDYNAKEWKTGCDDLAFDVIAWAYHPIFTVK